MSSKLLKLRYYLEIISLPAFVYLVIHLAGSGVMKIKNLDTNNAEHAHTNWFEHLLSLEILSGVILLILFVWIWHLSYFKKLVPCSHEHCHSEARTPHILAIVALCMHFFPESIVRNSLLNDKIAQGDLNLLVILGFGSHFLVDIIVAVIISSYWLSKKQFSLSLGIITGIWFIAYFTAVYFSEFVVNSYLHGIFFILSGFILSMFVHKPHKPVIKCHEC